MAEPAKPLLPQVLRHINHAAASATPYVELVLSRARDNIADVAAKRAQIENRIRVLQAHATRGSGMKRADLDRALESIVQDLRSL